MFCPDSNNEGSTTIPGPTEKYVNVVKRNLEKKYLTSRDYYNSKVVTDIIYNENTNLVSVFKDYLIYDDVSEFLKRFYMNNEFEERLPKIYEFYEKYSKVFPNYVNLPESKIMFKNIERKQKFIDDKQHAIDQQMRIKHKKNNGHFSDLLEDSSLQMFSTNFMESILKQDEELEKDRKNREARERFIKAIEEVTKNDSMMDAVNKSNITANISMSEMSNKPPSDISMIKSEFSELNQSSHHSEAEVEAKKAACSESKNDAKRKVNVFEYNNLANNNKKMRLINLSKPLQRTDIIQLESSLDLKVIFLLS
jgi:hypothetical protein